ncbi:MAG: beta-lactamase class A-like protein [Candidatus Woesebacteria bacterium GW2011_GWC2_45_9]|uniref:Beta-lactamase class A-like protein n=1 Tax=Candidatus Woesebacteria bacterium GW2011_GWC2_45_9 TaxID=1618589 RepID=A0A0G1R820_9BACT|nr:MAG: beta-lactamase class A-like protein [Candidatus Woesebacteria bacterium GW2011_GWC2_45_9]
MSIFRGNNSGLPHKKEEDYDYENEEFKDLKPENKRRRKEPPKPWGRPERLTVLIVILVTVLTSAILSLSARNFKLPGLPRISLPSFNWGEDTFYIEGDKEGREKAEKARNYFKDKTRNLSGLYAINVVRLLDGTSYGVNKNEEMQAASLIKLPIMTLVYKKFEAGQLDLDAKVSGSNSTYRELVEAMGQRSDNNAQIILVKTFGESEIQNYIESIGMMKTSLTKNETTPEEIGLFFKMLWEGKLTTEKHREELLGYMTDTIFADWIVEGIDDVRVAHKYGREVHVVNDAGIVFANKPFILVLMSDGAVESEADSLIPAVAREIYEIEIGN